jgi:hypothetical protein
MTAHTAVRGSGLVASAYGMLHCRDAIAALVAHWRAGPWKGRLDMPADLSVHVRAIRNRVAVEQRTSDEQQAAAIIAAAKVRFGQRRASPESEHILCLPGAMAELQSRLRGLVPHVAGGGQAALVSVGTYLPPAAWDWLCALEAHLATCSRSDGGAHAQRAQRGVYRRVRASVDEVAAFSEGEAAMLRAAGGELAALACPCHRTDVCMLFGPSSAVEIEVI